MKYKNSIKIGSVPIGGGAPVSIQSMTNTNTADIVTTLKQIYLLADAGCEIVRIAIPDKVAINALPTILKKSPIPVIGDIHFDHNLAIESIKAGIHAIRINPGNIGSRSRVEQVAKIAKEFNIPIRVGANSGSLPKGIYKNETISQSPDDAMISSLIKSALFQCNLLEEFDFHDIKVSLKSAIASFDSS